MGATGTILLTQDEEGMTTVMLSHGKQGSGAATSNPTTSAQSRTKPSIPPLPGPHPHPGDGAYAVAGPTKIVTPIPDLAFIDGSKGLVASL